MTATPQSNATLSDIARALLERDSFAVCGHVSPDGDCMGSALALTSALQALGKRATCLTASDEPLDPTLASLPGAGEAVPAKRFGDDVDAFVAVDVSTPGRLGDAAAVQARAPLSITVDHHACERRMSDLSFTDPAAASTTMLVWDLVGLLGAARTPAVAQCAYAGLMSDTGGFRFRNSDVHAFRAAADMVAAGADPARAACDFFQNRSLASHRLSCAAFAHLRLLGDDGSIALSFLSEADMDAAGAVRADAEPVIDDVRSVRGVRVACVLREQGRVVRGSLRAKDGTDVARIARAFGGGGHTAAAGFTVKASLEEAADLLSRTLVEEAGTAS